MSDQTNHLITWRNPRSTMAEAYRDLRTNINFLRLDKNLRTLLVTSSGPKEGKSTTCSNLAVTMAQAGNSVLLIDGDLRLPVIHTFFNFNNQFGLTNALFDGDNYQMYVRSTAVENLKVMTSGPQPPNPSELLGSNRMRKLVASLRNEFDMVLFDSPPVSTITDGVILASMLDGVLMVVLAGGIEREVVKLCKHKIDAVRANLIGCVLNRVDIDEERYYYKYYNYYHNYHYGYGSFKGDKKK